MSEQNSGDGIERDLFGAPVEQIKERWGRPGFAKNEQNQRLVATLRAAGWSQGRIAAYLRCDEKTLRKHFSRELQAGADLIEGQALEVMVSKMRQGNMPAVRRVLDLVREGKASPPVPQPDRSAEDQARPLGKKEQLAEAAKNPGTGWGNLLN